MRGKFTKEFDQNKNVRTILSTHDNKKNKKNAQKHTKCAKNTNYAKIGQVDDKYPFEL